VIVVKHVKLLIVLVSNHNVIFVRLLDIILFSTRSPAIADKLVQCFR